MAQEIELKLAVPDFALGVVAAWLDANGAPQGEVTLCNVYLDTPARELAKAHAALRLRRKGEQWLQTLKTAGDSQGGLATRHEWENPVAGEAIELDAFPDEARTLLAPLADRLAPVFRTDFVRRTWLVEEGGARIEAALDTGRIIAGAHEEPIQEVELEWLSGDQSHAADTLHALARRLQAVAPVTPSDLSKAARGYRLAGL